MPAQANAEDSGSGYQLKPPEPTDQPQIKEISVQFSPTDQPLVDYGDGKGLYKAVEAELKQARGIALRQLRIVQLAAMADRKLDDKPLKPEQEAEFRVVYGKFAAKVGAERSEAQILESMLHGFDAEMRKHQLTFPQDHALRRLAGAALTTSMTTGKPTTPELSLLIEWAARIPPLEDPRKPKTKS